MMFSYMKQSNTASSAVAKSNGMRFPGEFRDEEGETTVVYGITRAEWQLLKK